MAKKLLEDVLPRYGFPTDNSLVFVSQVNQSLAIILGIDWTLCIQIPEFKADRENKQNSKRELY